jgi:hypothetical protein
MVITSKDEVNKKISIITSYVQVTLPHSDNPE